MKTDIENRSKSLLKKFHTLCTIRGMKPEEKDAILAAYKVESSKDLTEKQLLEIINSLESGPDQWRKRVLAAVGSWLRSINKEDNAPIIKGIACRATGYDDFNRIPVSRLRDLYYEFSKKANTVKTINLVTSEEIAIQTFSN